MNAEEYAEELVQELEKVGVKGARVWEHAEQTDEAITIYHTHTTSGHGDILVASRNKWDERRKKRTFIRD